MVYMLTLWKKLLRIKDFCVCVYSWCTHIWIVAYKFKEVPAQESFSLFLFLFFLKLINTNTHTQHGYVTYPEKAL